MTANSITPKDLDIVRERTAFLNKAQSILNEQYLKKKAESYKKWQQDSHQMWITQGILLPYQSAFEYPTQEEIVAKALEIYNEKYKDSVQTNTSPPPKEVTPWEMYLNPPPSPIEPVVEQPQETKIEEPAEVNVEPVVEQSQLVEEEPIEEPEAVEVEIVGESEEIKQRERQTSYLRQLLAQFITVAKDLDSKTKKEDEK